MSNMSSDFESWLSSIEDILEDARNGRMFILVDAEQRENEGDLVILAEHATPEAINFMAQHGRGLICLALTPERAQHLRLPLMNPENESSFKTAFTVSIEAREGITTGISAADRARTIAVAIDPQKTHEDIVSPGHMFPVLARPQGVLMRPGHTEAIVDIARIVGANPAGVMCEIMKDDGTMARMPDLVAFAQKHALKIATIESLRDYRQAHEPSMSLVGEHSFSHPDLGKWDCHFFQEITSQGILHHLVFEKGKRLKKIPSLVRIQPLDLVNKDPDGIDFDDLFDTSHMGPDHLDFLLMFQSMLSIHQHKKGAIICTQHPQERPSLNRLPPLSQENARVAREILNILDVPALIPLMHPAEDSWDLDLPSSVTRLPAQLMVD